MRVGGGHAKGAAFERTIARRLSAWLTHGRSRSQLIRTRGSGAHPTGDEPWRQAGDLGPNGPVGESFRQLWIVECKDRQRCDWWSFWTDMQPGKPKRKRKSDSSIAEWWAKLSIEALGLRLQPMMVFHEIRKPHMVMLPFKILEARCRSGMVIPKSVERMMHMHGCDIGTPAVVFPFDDLIGKCDPGYFGGEWQ